MTSSSPLKTNLQQTKQKYKNSIRKKQLQQKFQSIRIKLLDLPTINQQQYQKSKSSQISKLNQFLSTLESHPQKSQEIIEVLWNQYISYRFNYFNQEHINQLIKEFIKIKKNIVIPQQPPLKLQDHQNDNNNQSLIKMICIIIWLISNRFTRHHDLNPQNIHLSTLILAELQLLQLNLSLKLNHLILLNFTNLSKYHNLQYTLIQNHIIPTVLNCHLFQDKQQDISIFLSNLIYNLPYQYKLKQEQCLLLINFINQKYNLITKERFIFEDCLLILNKLLIINQGGFYAMVLERLERVIEFYIRNLNRHINNKLEDIFQLLINVYSTHSSNQGKNNKIGSKGLLYNEQLYLFIWNNVDIILQGQNLKYLEEDRPLTRLIWKFLTIFCSIKSSQIISKIIHEIYIRFDSDHDKKISDCQQIALKIIIQHYHIKDQLDLLPFWSVKLSQYYNIDHICLGLLKRIDTLLTAQLSNHTNSNYELIFGGMGNQGLRELIGSLQFSQDLQIKNMAGMIIQRQKSMKE